MLVTMLDQHSLISALLSRSHTKKKSFDPNSLGKRNKTHHRSMGPTVSQLVKWKAGIRTQICLTRVRSGSLFSANSTVTGPEGGLNHSKSFHLCQRNQTAGQAGKTSGEGWSAEKGQEERGVPLRESCSLPLCGTSAAEMTMWLHLPGVNTPWEKKLCTYHSHHSGKPTATRSTQQPSLTGNVTLAPLPSRRPQAGVWA